MNKEELGIIKEQLPREELVENYKSISKLNKKYCKDNIDLQQRIYNAISYIKKCKEYHKIHHHEEKMYPDELISLEIILNGEWKDLGEDNDI